MYIRAGIIFKIVGRKAGQGDSLLFNEYTRVTLQYIAFNVKQREGGATNTYLTLAGATTLFFNHGDARRCLNGRLIDVIAIERY